MIHMINPVPSMPTNRELAPRCEKIEDSANIKTFSRRAYNKHHDVTLQISRMKYSDILRDKNG